MLFTGSQMGLSGALFGIFLKAAIYLDHHDDANSFSAYGQYADSFNKALDLSDENTEIGRTNNEENKITVDLEINEFKANQGYH